MESDCTNGFHLNHLLYSGPWWSPALSTDLPGHFMCYVGFRFGVDHHLFRACWLFFPKTRMLCFKEVDVETSNVFLCVFHLVPLGLAPESKSLGVQG